MESFIEIFWDKGLSLCLHLYRECDVGSHSERGQLVGDQFQVEFPDCDLKINVNAIILTFKQTDNLSVREIDVDCFGLLCNALQLRQLDLVVGIPTHPEELRKRKRSWKPNLVT